MGQQDKKTDFWAENSMFHLNIVQNGPLSDVYVCSYN